MDWVPQASGVFISRVQPVAQVIPGIKGYDWITAASLPLEQGLTPALCLWMKTDRKCLLESDSFFAYLSLMEDELLYSLPEARYFSVGFSSDLLPMV